MTTLVKPEQVVIDKPMTAQELFLLAVAGNPNNLAAAVSTKPGETYTLTTNIVLQFSRDDVRRMLSDGGYEVSYHDAEGERP
jgi:hypothetical protein